MPVFIAMTANKKNFFLFLFLILGITEQIYAQSRQYVLKGFMGIQGGESFTYKLELHDSLDGVLSGYAYTWLNEKNDVKAAVIAYLDRAARTLHLKETHIVHNNHFNSKALICLADAELRYRQQEKNLSGPLKTHTSGNDAACSPGSISFSNPEELALLFSAVAPTDIPKEESIVQPRKAARIIIDTLVQQRTPSRPVKIAETANITTGKDKTYLWESDQVILEVWDDNTIDNDKISILYNGVLQLDNYTLNKEKKKLILPVGGNELNIISIVANNEGNDPPNTATIRLTDGTTIYNIVAHNKMGKSAVIKIRKAQ